MEKFKLDIFKSENPGLVLDFQNLDLFTSGKIIGMLLSFLGYDSIQIVTSQLFNDIQGRSFSKINYDGEVTTGFLNNLISDLDIDKDDKLFVIWDLKSSVDVFAADTLVRYWNFIWYDTSDEGVLLFIPDRKLGLFVTDRGYISVLRELKQ